MSVGSLKIRKNYMTHDAAYRRGQRDHFEGVRYSNPPEEVLDTNGLLRNWQEGWLEGSTEEE